MVRRRGNEWCYRVAWMGTVRNDHVRFYSCVFVPMRSSMIASITAFWVCFSTIYRYTAVPTMHKEPFMQGFFRVSYYVRTSSFLRSPPCHESYQSYVQLLTTSCVVELKRSLFSTRTANVSGRGSTASASRQQVDTWEKAMN